MKYNSELQNSTTVHESVASQVTLEDQEMLDLVDSQDQVVCSMLRRDVYAQNLCHQMRSVWLMIKNEQGQFWIPQRSLTVSRLPGYLDGSVAGHVQAGENYDQALIRETAEEVGIHLSAENYRLLGKLTPEQHQSFCFAQVYEMTISQAPENWNRQDIDSWYWLTPSELLAKYHQGEKVKDTLPLIIQNFYS